MPDQTTPQTPPSADSQRAQQYIDKIIPLVSSDQITIKHTNLSQFDPSNIQDHYELAIENFNIELSHTKRPDTGQDMFVMVFNKLEGDANTSTNKTLLAFAYLQPNQFQTVKQAADEQEKRQKIQIEDKRFTQALEPIDQIFSKMSSNGQPSPTQPPAPIQQQLNSTTAQPVQVVTQTTPQNVPQASSPQPAFSTETIVQNSPPITASQSNT